MAPCSPKALGGIRDQTPHLLGTIFSGGLIHICCQCLSQQDNICYVGLIVHHNKGAVQCNSVVSWVTHKYTHMHTYFCMYLRCWRFYSLTHIAGDLQE